MEINPRRASYGARPLMAMLRGVWRAGPLMSRIVAAMGGGYVVAALASVAVLALPISRPQAVLTGMLASFALYTCAVIWVFAVRSAWRAWAGLVLVAVPLFWAAWSVWTSGGATP